MWNDDNSGESSLRFAFSTDGLSLVMMKMIMMNTLATVVLVMEGVSRVVATSIQLSQDFSHMRKSPPILLRFRRRSTRHCLDKSRRDSGWILGGILATKLAWALSVTDSGWNELWIHLDHGPWYLEKALRSKVLCSVVWCPVDVPGPGRR